jgi:hypothetical protein
MWFWFGAGLNPHSPNFLISRADGTPLRRAILWMNGKKMEN